MRTALSKRSVYCRWLSVVIAIPLAFACSSAGAQTLIEDVELPKPVILQSGVPIPSLDEAAKQAIVIDSNQPAQPHQAADIREYQLGTSTVKEYRNGDQLLYVEVINEAGSTYVVDYRTPNESRDRKPRAGVIVSTW